MVKDKLQEAMAYLRTIANSGGTAQQMRELAAKGIERVEAISASAQDEAQLKTDDQLDGLLASIINYGSWKYAEAKGRVEPDLSDVRSAWDEVYEKVQALASRPAAASVEHQRLRDLVDVVWNEATNSTAVPSTPWADRMIDKVFPSLPDSTPVAGEAQPVAWVAADTLNSPHPTCISSLAYMSQLDRDRGREYVPLYAAPQASPAADERDAKRLDFVEANCTIWDGTKHIKATRSAIDAAIAAQQGEGSA